jgi:hypothetical protein
MIDSGATGNFMSPDTVKRLNVPVRSINPYDLTVVDGTDHDAGKVTKGTIPTKMTIGRHTEEIQMDVVPMGRHEAILGMPWIKQHNPEIDWKTRTVEFSRCACEKAE